MADFIGDSVSAASDLAHELRCAAGTVLTILGSHLESTERARVDATAVCAGCGHARVDHVELVGRCGRRVGPERVPCGCKQYLDPFDGPQWLNEFEEQRDSLEPSEVCAFHGEWCAGEASWCTRQCNKCDEAVYWHRDVEAWFHCAGVNDRRPCPYGDGPVVEHSSAATPHAADPSPTVPNAHSVVGGEGSGGASDILQSAPPERPQCGAQFWCRDLYICSRPRGHDGLHGYAGVFWPEAEAEYPKSDPGEVAAPAPGERVTIPVLPPDEAGARPNDWDAVMAAYDAVAEWLDRADNGAALIGCTPSMVAGVAIKAYRTALLSVGHEDLSAHLTGAAIRANTGHPDVLIDAFASSLLADYRITRK